MDILYLLVPLGILFVFFLGFVFWWALNNRQFDELDEVGNRILEDSDTPVNVPLNEKTE
jgi:cbb3-type cytochrome oxidase maturation protein